MPRIVLYSPSPFATGCWLSLVYTRSPQPLHSNHPTATDTGHQECQGKKRLAQMSLKFLPGSVHTKACAVYTRKHCTSDREEGSFPTEEHTERQEEKQQAKKTRCPRPAIGEGDRTHRGGARVLGPPQTARREQLQPPETPASQEQRAGPHSPEVLSAPVFSRLGTGDRKEAAWLRKCSCCRTSS